LSLVIQPSHSACQQNRLERLTWYVENKFPLVKLLFREKKAFEKEWQKNPYFNIDVKYWVTNFNWGILLGTEHQPGKYLHAIDVDYDDGGEPHWIALQKAFGSLGGTLTTKTRSGFHPYFYLPFRLENDVRIDAGVTVKGKCHFLVGAGSIHPEGGMYSFHTWDEPFDLPTDWVDLILHRISGRRTTTFKPWDGKPQFLSLYAQEIIENGFNGKDGSRNETAFRVAKDLFRTGISENDILETLLGIKFTPPLDEKLITARMRSAYKHLTKDANSGERSNSGNQ